MPAQPEDSPLGAFLKALQDEEIDSILIGAMAAVQQGAPLMTIDYNFWVRLPERHYPRILAVIQRLGGKIRARTPYELSDSTQINAVFQPDGLRSFQSEWDNCLVRKIENVRVRVLPLSRVIASKRAANRDKDIAVLPILQRTLRLTKALKRKDRKSNSARKRRKH